MGVYCLWPSERWDHNPLGRSPVRLRGASNGTTLARIIPRLTGGSMRPKLLVAIAVCCALLVGTVAVLAQGPQPQGVTAALGSGFTYQGQLIKNGVPVNGTCHFTF